MIWLRILVFLVAAAAAFGAHGQIAFRGASTGVASGGGGGTITHIGAGADDSRDNCGNITPAVPAGANGDVLVALVNAMESSANITMTGWNQLYADTYPGQDFKVAVFWRLATGGDPNTVNQSGTCSSIAAQISRFRGADPAQPFETNPIPAGNVARQNSGALDTGTQTTTLNGSMLLVAGFVNDDRTVAAAGGWSQSFDSDLDLTRDLGLSLHFQLQASAGSASVSNWDLSGNGNDENYGIIFALRPASTGLTISVPAGTLAEDVMIASVTVRPCSNTSGAACTLTVPTPAGWTLIRAIDQTTGAGTGGYGNRLLVYRRVATAAEPASYTLTFAGTPVHAGAAGAILSFSGVDTANPIVAEAGQVTPSARTHTAPSINTGTAINTVLISSHSANSAASWAPPAGMTERVDIASVSVPDDLGLALEVNTQNFPTAGATGTRTATHSNPPAADTGAAHMLALRPLEAVLHWTMDQSSWNGTAGEVLDLTGNGLHGTALNGANTANATPAIAGNPGTCQYGSLDGANDFLQVADHPLLDVTDELTVMVWIRPTALPAAGGLKTIVSKDQNYEFHLNSAGRINWWWGGGALELTSAGTVALNTWTHVAIVYSRSGAFQRIYVNGVQDANTNNQNGALVPNAMPFQVGGDQGFAGREFAGFVDEVRVYRAALSATAIQTLRNETRPCAASVNHFNISHAGSGVACVDQTITITAHDASHAAVDAGGVSINLSTSHGRGTWTGIVAGGGVLNDPTAGDGAATYTFAAGSTQVILLFRNTNVTSASETFSFNVVSGGLSEASGAANASDDPSFTMAQAGFVFTTIPTQLSGKPSNTGYNSAVLAIQAVDTDAGTGSCTTLFASQNRTVQIGAECNNPGACVGQALNVNGTNVATSDDNGVAGAGNYTDVILAFGATSQASVVISYPAAGQMSLHARYDLNPAVIGYEMIGSSNAFVVRPFALRLGATTATPGPTAAALARAGENFNVSVTAVQWQAAADANNDGVPDSDAVISTNPVALNFGLESVPAGASLSAALNEPVGGNAPALAGATNFTGFVAATKTQAVSWPEVGFINLRAEALNYLGGGSNITNTLPDGLIGVGRFRPDHFVVDAAPVPTLTNRVASACGSTFTYMNEGIGLVFKLQARNMAGVLTQNYTGGYGRLNSVGELGFGAVNGATNLSGRIDTVLVPLPAFANGELTLNTTVSLLRSTPDNPDGPFAATSIGIRPTDEDGTLLQPAALNMDVDGAGGNDHQRIGNATEIRFGRLRLQNAVGSEKLALPVPIETQYWNGAGFVTNTQDGCTSLPRSAIVLGAYSGALAPGGGNCKTFVQQDPVAFAGGVGTLSLAAPAGGVGGSVQLTANLGTAAAGSFCDNATSGENAATAAARSYLFGRWNDAATSETPSSPTTAYDDNPPARAAFGLYGAQPNNFIYFRENF